MKKYFILVTSLLAMLMLSACSKESPTEPVENPDQGTTKGMSFNNAEGTYYGELKGEGVGFYSVLFTNDIGDKLRLDCYGSVSTNARNARLTSGDYKAGNASDLTARTFIVGTSEGEDGTIYWRNNQAYMVDGGTLTIQNSNGSYTIRFALTAGDQTINATYTGTFTLANEAAVPPRESQPNPRPVTDMLMQYSGLSVNSPKAAFFAMRLYYKGTKASNNNVEVLQLTGYMPVQEDNNNVYLPEGTYTISSDMNNMEEFTIEAGAVASGGIYTGSYEYYTNQNGSIVKIYMVNDGAMTVEKDSSDNYTITVRVTGYRADQTGIISDRAEEIVYEYKGKLDPMMNYADPISNLDKSVDLGEFTNAALCQTIHKLYDTPYSGYYYFIWDENLDVEISESDATIYVKGKGSMIMLFLIGEPQYNKPPVGHYPMGELWGFIERGEGYEYGCAQPGSTLVENSIDPTYGCWYTEVIADGKDMQIEAYAGAIGGAQNGYVDTDDNRIEFLFYDRNGNKFSGTYVGEVGYFDVSASPQSMTRGNSAPFLYIPSVTMHDAVPFPMQIIAR